MCERDYENTKGYAVKGTQEQAQVRGIGGYTSGSPNPLRQAQHEVKHLEDQLANRKRGLEFLTKHPEFGEFLELQRMGCL